MAKVVFGRLLLAAGVLAARAGFAARRLVPPAAIIQAVRRFDPLTRALTARAARIATKAPPRVATRAPIRGAPKLLKPVARITRAPRRAARLARGAVAAAGAGAAFFAGEQIARKVFKPRAPSPVTTGTGAIPRDGGAPTGAIAAGAVAGALLPAAVRTVAARGTVGRTVGIVSGVTGLARRAALPAAAGAGVVAIGGQIVDSQTGEVVGARRVKRSRIGFKRSDLKAFNRVISTAKRVKKILTKAGMGRTFRSTARVSHAQLSSEHKR